jgi:hypothetical protein
MDFGVAGFVGNGDDGGDCTLFCWSDVFERCFWLDCVLVFCPLSI